MADISQTHPYTCNSCAVAFRNSDAQRTHMRSDWHRYNLKRKVADLPPVSSEDYNQKVLSAQASTNAAKESASFVKSCTICQKTYYSENAFQNHLTSQKHKANLLAGKESPVLRRTDGEEIPAEAEAEFENVVSGMKTTSLTDVPRRPSAPAPGSDKPDHPLSPPTKISSLQTSPLDTCLFCNYVSPNTKLNVTHMTKIHGLFIPESAYLVDQDGLIQYLFSKIHENNECISCHKLRNSTEAIQTHMRDKGHCMIAFESEEEMIEIGQFYDFSSTYSDDEDEDESRAGGADVTGDEAEGEGWETDSDASSVASDEITSIPNDDRTDAYSKLKNHRHHSNGTATAHKNSDGFHSHAHHHNNAVFYDDHEMHLPSGRVAGHRSMKTYFRQNLSHYSLNNGQLERQQRLLKDGPRRSSTEDVSDSDQEMADAEDTTGTNNNRQLLRRGEAGMLGVTASQKREVMRAQEKSQRNAQRKQSRYQARLEKQNNNQKHFRDPLLQ